MVSASFKYVPQTAATTFALYSVFILLLCGSWEGAVRGGGEDKNCCQTAMSRLSWELFTHLVGGCPLDRDSPLTLVMF